MKQYHHKPSNQILTFGGPEGASMQQLVSGIYGSNLTLGELVKGVDWEEIIEYPIGTKIFDTKFNKKYTKSSSTAWRNYKTNTVFGDFETFDESQIGEGKRFEVIKSSYKWEVLKAQYSENGQISIGGDVILQAKRISDNQVINLGDDFWYPNFGKCKVTELYWAEDDCIACGDFDMQFAKFKKDTKPEYTILSFKQNSAITDLWRKFSHGWCRTNNLGQPITKAYSDNEILNHTLYSIYSIKRESDSEVFTVKDIVKIWDGQKTIEAIYFTDTDFLGPLRFKMEGQKDCSKSKPWSGYTLDSMTKVKKFLTTEDGVDIYGKTLVYCLSKKWAVCSMIVGNPKYDSKHLSTWLKFSTKQARWEYAFKHYPGFSIHNLESLGIRADGFMLKGFLENKVLNREKYFQED